MTNSAFRQGTARIPPGTYESLRRAAYERRVTMNQVVAVALDEWFAHPVEPGPGVGARNRKATKRITVGLYEEGWRVLYDRAEREGRSVSGIVQVALARHLT